MKTKQALFFFLCISILTILITTDKKIKPVSLEVTDDHEYNIYSVECTDLTLNNISQYFNQSDIIGIYPYYNPLYQNQFQTFIYFPSNNFNEFEKKYYSTLSKKGFYQEITKYKLNGIKIKGLKVHMTLNQVKQLTKQCKIID